jgi:hypothetical protein
MGGEAMARYLLIYHGGGMPESPDEQARVMAAWGAWFQESGGAIADPGNPVGQTRMVASDGSVSTGGGAGHATGYSILEAEGMDAALAIARRCPVLQGGASIEVAETFNAM